MGWKKFSNEKPPYKKKVLIWRILREKYTIGYLDLCSSDGESEEKVSYWVTQQNCMHECLEDDMWLEFEPYTCCLEKTY